MGVIVYAGIDEAGYGPMLGPLCVGLTAIELRDADPADTEATKIWSRFPGIICRRASAAGTTKIAVDDSKALKLPNNSPNRDPLTHLERGVLASLIAMGSTHADDDGFFEALGIRTSGLPWYTGEPCALPLGTTSEHIGLLGARLRSSFERKGYTVRRMRCACVDERVFNRLYDGVGSKASVAAHVIAELIRELVSSYRGREDVFVRLAIDRQGGRQRYAPMLRHVLRTDSIATVRESEDESVYEVNPGEGPSMRIEFRVEGDTAHYPVALASMTAKLVRELMMRRFNRYWNARNPELKPTAGYTLDARRWLSEADGLITPDERTLLVRKA